jgi:hypothetical protein
VYRGSIAGRDHDFIARPKREDARPVLRGWLLGLECKEQSRKFEWDSAHVAERWMTRQT